MYYYITEPLTTSAEKKRVEDIKSILSQLGIAGEFAVASPARTVTEHLDLAFKKGFTTIVGIGDDALANTIASAMLHRNYDKAALGMIPWDNRQELWQMIGAHSIKDLCQTLRTRLVTSVDAVELDSTHSFITSAAMILPKPVRFRLTYNTVVMLGQCTHLTISKDGQVEIWDETYRLAGKQSGSFLGRLFGASNNNDHSLSLTSFVSDHWQFETEQPCPLLVSGVKATETPLEVIRRPKALKLIVNRAKITTDKEKE